MENNFGVLSQEEIDAMREEIQNSYTPEMFEKNRKIFKAMRKNNKSKKYFKLKDDDNYREETEVLSKEEIDALLAAINAGDSDEPECFRPAVDCRKIKIYDFKRPDKFSKEQIRAISMMHETFARLTTTSLSGKLRSICHVHVASVDQLTYEEFVRSVPTPTTLGIINMDPLNGNIIMEIDPAITFSIIDRLLGGEGIGIKCQHELTDIESSIMENIIVRTLGNLREAWTNILDLRPRLGQIDTNPQFAQIVPPTEMTVLVTLEVKIHETEGMINLCYPYETLETIMDKLSAQYWFSSKKKIVPAKINYDDMSVILKAEIGTTEITVKEFNELKIGDHLKLNDDYKLKVNNIFLSNFLQNEKCGKKFIEVRGINKHQEKNYMEEKHNVLYEEGGLDQVKVQIICELGRAIRTMKDVKGMGEGTILELNKLAGEPVDVFVNNVLAAKGEVVVIDENFGIRIVEMISKS